MLAILILVILICAFVMVYGLRNGNGFLLLPSVFLAMACAALIMRKFHLADFWMVVFIGILVGITYIIDEYVLP